MSPVVKPLPEHFGAWRLRRTAGKDASAPGRDDQFIEAFDEWLKAFDIPEKLRIGYVRDIRELSSFLDKKPLRDVTKTDVGGLMAARAGSLPKLHPRSFHLFLAWRQLPTNAICSVCGKASIRPKGWFSIRFKEGPQMWTIEHWNAHPLFERWKVACGVEHAQQLFLEWTRRVRC
jgi:hypothetical protein